MIWLLIVAIVVALICLLPIGFIAIYDASGCKVALKIGFLKFTVLPKKAKRPRKNVPTKNKNVSIEKETDGGSWKDFLPVARAIVSFLNDLRMRITVKEFNFKLVMAGDDPCDLGTNYGRTWAFASALQPHLDRLFRIKKQKIDINCDYCAEKTKVFCCIHASISLFRITQLLIRHGLRIYKQYTELKKL